MCLMLGTQVTRKILQLSRANIIGQEGRNELLILLLGVWNVERSRLSIDAQLVFYNHFPFLSGNGKW
jgi:hypothetical protein